MKNRLNLEKLVKVAAFGGVLASVGCGSEKPVVQAVEPVQEEKEAVSPKVVLYSWDEYFKPEVLKRFAERTGIEVVYETFDNTDEMQEQLKSNPGAHDVIVADDLTLKLLVTKRMLLEVDHAKIPNLENIGARWRDSDDKFSAPYMWGTTLLAYRSDKIENPEESWSLLFDERYSGKVSMLEERLECFAAALYSAGYSGSSKDPDELGVAREKLLSIVRDGRVKFGSDNDMKEHLISGKSWVAQMYSGDAALIADPETNPDENIAFFIPQEGASTWVDSFAIARDSSRVDAAHQFINYMLDAKVGAESSNYLWYATPNVASKPYLDEELATDTTIFPPQDVLEKCRFLDSGDVTRERIVNMGWADVQRAYLNPKEGSSEVAGDAVTEPGDGAGE